MTKYDIIFEELQEKVESGVLTLEDAEVLNEIAFEKYSDDDTEYEAVIEGAYDKDVRMAENDIKMIKKAADKRVEQIENDIKKLQKERDKVYERLEQRLVPYEKRLDHYERLNMEDPDGKKKKRNNAIAAGLTVGAAAAMFGHEKYKEAKQGKRTPTKTTSVELNDGPEKKAIEKMYNSFNRKKTIQPAKTPDFKNSHR